jgi:hypothetical protein
MPANNEVGGVNGAAPNGAAMGMRKPWPTQPRAAVVATVDCGGCTATLNCWRAATKDA